MEVTLDKYGRIVIPKPVRDALGLEAGATLHLETPESASGEREIALRPERKAPVLQRRNGVLVHTGKADPAIDGVEAIRRSREERMRKHAGGPGIVSDD